MSDAPAESLPAPTVMEPITFELTVVAIEDVSASMGRMHLRAPELTSFHYEPGQDLLFNVETRDGTAVRRRYTIRGLNPTAGVVAVDFVRHGDGPAARFFAAAQPGQRVQVTGPRGKIFLAQDADWHLFVGDEAFIPAAATMAEALPASARALLYLEVDAPADEPPLHIGARLDALEFAHRHGEDPGRSAVLLEAISTVKLPTGRGHAYLGGEHRAVRALTEALLTLGMDLADCSPKPYWRLGVPNANHGEPPRD